MQTKGWRLGPLETKFFAWAEMRRVQTVRTGDLVQALKITPQQEADLFHNMRENSRLVQLQRGLYLAPPRLPPGGKWVPSPLLIVAVLMRELKASYQVSGMVAFAHHGLTTQVAIETSVYNTRLSGRRTIGGLPFVFIKVAENSLGEADTVKILGANESVRVSSLVRTLVDAVNDYSRFGSLPRAYYWIEGRKGDNDLMRSLVKTCLDYGNVATRRRIGCWLELTGTDTVLVRRLYRSVKKTSAFIPLAPKAGGGITNKRWGVLVNVEINRAEEVA